MEVPPNWEDLDAGLDIPSTQMGDRGMVASPNQDIAELKAAFLEVDGVFAALGAALQRARHPSTFEDLSCQMKGIVWRGADDSPVLRALALLRPLMVRRLLSPLPPRAFLVKTL